MQQTCYVLLLLLYSIYYVWRAGNQAMWQQVVPRPETLLKEIKSVVCSRVRAKMSEKWSSAKVSWLTGLIANRIS